MYGINELFDKILFVMPIDVFHDQLSGNLKCKKFYFVTALK